MCKKVLLLVTLSAVFVAAAITINDLVPYDSNVSDGYWNTTGHVGVEVAESGGAIAAPDFRATTVASAGFVDFDPRACTCAGSNAVIGFRTDKSDLGLTIIIK